ncbi:magnesium/cobalt transporter CorA [Geobacter sp. DSM 9736]|uniref:magnesium/cobalt transporter CorA n=1 Tax=Geobacter sp. DSM 9736 TaxID=1277350 RepID=UPI000B50C316|nr:magnesium/cobalt transporter CorA [Geobacter sp. DSM 9736]
MTETGTADEREAVVRSRSAKSGLPPGTLVHIGEKSDREIRISVLDYGEGRLEEREITSLKDSFYYMDTDTVTWIDVEGLHEIEIIQKLGEQGVHPLVLEDIVNTAQRPKIEDYGEYLYIVLRMLHPTDSGFRSEQVSLVTGRNFVISFQEGITGDAFRKVKERIRGNKGRIRSMGADYLAYSLIDLVVDDYFTVLEGMGERIEDLEERVLTEATTATTRVLQQLKRELIAVRRSVWPLRELLAALGRRESSLISDQVAVYLRDVYDHVVELIDTVEADREMLAGIHDIYLSTLSNRMNEIIKFLTIIGTIFIPLTFIAGVYGMNFEHMPELHWRYGYFGVLILMLLVALSLLGFFKHKKWL